MVRQRSLRDARLATALQGLRTGAGVSTKKQELTDSQFDHLYEKANSKGEKTQVDRQALMNLLIDHGRMVIELHPNRKHVKAE